VHSDRDVADAAPGVERDVQDVERGMPRRRAQRHAAEGGAEEAGARLEHTLTLRR
jgi:hypothetical protein